MDGLLPLPLDPLRIAVLLGGNSAERPISLESGAAVSQALSQRGHHIRQIDPARFDLEHLQPDEIDVAFLALHGTFGEDGGVQSILEDRQITFTGSGSDASRLAFSKSASKERFRQYQLPTPDYTLIHLTDSPDHIHQQACELGFPLVVKPNAQGSSVAVTIVRDETELDAAVSRCFAVESFGLLERFVDGSEWTLSVIDNDPLPLIRIGTDREFFDWKAKYEDDATRYEFDSDVDQATLARLEQTGLAACRHLGTRGIARVDMMLDSDGSAQLLEVNTIPGMTSHSLVPKAAARAGLTFGDVCEIAVTRALSAGRTKSLRDAS